MKQSSFLYYVEFREGLRISEALAIVAIYGRIYLDNMTPKVLPPVLL